ncbi:isopenicillin N synthase family oxygenase [Mangrovimicrobium sediminis]|uniref:2-oxoglutarate-dependent ethylene/succinate-forming enzyme n=2 Tax=Mangrovimicrobium sediminis TaxID=2562682 RepID=A0A4Z0M5Y4_9GAMM|nr:isopenicillin N synthase family oxygenase [Haliea sp. SAOS-164]
MDIPLIDFASYDESDATAMRKLAEQVNAALTGIGFMSLKNIGIPPELQAEIFAASRAYFSQPEAEKRKLGYSSAEDNFGYQGVCEESLEPGQPPDLKEALTMRDLDSKLSLEWPDPDFRDLLHRFYRECLSAAYRIMRVFSIDLDVPEDYFVKVHSGENVTMRLLHYPPLSATTHGQLGAGAHTDYGMITLLFQDEVGGLEVRDTDGQWHPVTPVPGAVVINVGDLTERWTNRRYRSSMHRVQPRGGVGDRYSIAMFVDPDPQTEVVCLPSCTDDAHPPLYPPTSAGEHILQRIQATHLGA